MEEHKRLEAGADGGDAKIDSRNANGGRAPATTHEGDSSSSLPDQTMAGERPLETSDREPPATDEIPARPEPTSAEGVRREGVHETSDQTSASSVGQSKDRVTDTAPPMTLAYTNSQRSNLPDCASLDIAAHADAQGAGKLEEPVERRANGLVFDDRSGNYVVKDEAHATGVTSQDKT